jgi:8-oxo-dGTP pyrophosphatase MutT (NUDIX family)
VRELREETGINAEESELILLGAIWGTSAIVDSYALRKDVSLDDLRMQEGETCAAQWVTLEKLNSMNTQGLIADPVGFRLKPLYDHFFRFVQG